VDPVPRLLCRSLASGCSSIARSRASTLAITFAVQNDTSSDITSAISYRQQQPEGAGVKERPSATAAATATATCGHAFYHWNAFDRRHAGVHGARCTSRHIARCTWRVSDRRRRLTGAFAHRAIILVVARQAKRARGSGSAQPCSVSDSRSSSTSSSLSSEGVMGTCRRPLRRVPARYQPRKPP